MCVTRSDIDKLKAKFPTLQPKLEPEPKGDKVEGKTPEKPIEEATDAEEEQKVAAEAADIPQSSVGPTAGRSLLSQQTQPDEPEEEVAGTPYVPETLNEQDNTTPVEEPKKRRGRKPSKKDTDMIDKTETTKKTRKPASKKTSPTTSRRKPAASKRRKPATTGRSKTPAPTAAEYRVALRRIAALEKALTKVNNAAYTALKNK